MSVSLHLIFFFFFNDTATTEIYTLSLHDALPISGTRGSESERIRRTNHGMNMPVVDATGHVVGRLASVLAKRLLNGEEIVVVKDRKSTRLNSSHSQISYAVFCLKKKKNTDDRN